MNLISRISLIGLDPDSPFSLRNKLKVFNIAMFSVCLISVFYCLTALTHNYVLSSIVTLYSIVTSLLVLFIVHLRRYNLAFHIAVWYGFTFLSAFSYIFGYVTHSYLYLMFLPIAINIIFDNKRIITFYFVLCILVTIANFVMMENTEPYYKVQDGEKWLGYPNLAFVPILIFLSVRMFKNENRKYATRIEEQKAILEQKNEEITDSINYARRIQAALMAPASLMKKNLPEHFIFYKPKAIVSGDFYFAAEGNDNRMWLCVGDCTGHGVPGAFMSLLNISILRELISDQNVSTPDVVLNRQRDGIVAALNPHGAEEAGQDGMDCILMCIDRQRKKLQLACANNPLWIRRGSELLEFKADKQPVGLFAGHASPFTLQEVELQSGDIIYAMTDGFADQFGGPRGKKFKWSQLKDKLNSLGDISMQAHSRELNSTFEEWRGELEQVDDVLIVGIRVS